MDLISVEHAIKRGKWLVVYSTIFIMAAGFIISWCLAKFNFIEDWLAVVGMLCAVFIGYLYRGVMSFKWRIWAFENVRNVHELKRHAILEKLIVEEGNFFERIELKTRLEKEKWESLQAKFEHSDEFNDDLSIPIETRIYYSVKSNIFYSAVFIFGSTYVMLFWENYLLSIILFSVGIFFAFLVFKRFGEKGVLILINASGIKVRNEFYYWVNIKNENVITVTDMDESLNYLMFDSGNDHEKIELSDLKIDRSTLLNLLIVYRARFEKNANN